MLYPTAYYSIGFKNGFSFLIIVLDLVIAYSVGFSFLIIVLDLVIAYSVGFRF